jgi:hypothetical protein
MNIIYFKSKSQVNASDANLYEVLSKGSLYTKRLIIFTWALRSYALTTRIIFYFPFFMFQYIFQEFIIIYVNVKFNLN